MFNSQRPSAADLPTNAQLFKATAFALVTASVLLVAVVVPAEYGKDPTGIGTMLGFTEMGEIKEQLAQEAAADAAAVAVSQVRAVAAAPAASETAEPETPAAAEAQITEVTLAPGEAAEVKAAMAQGDALEYDWAVSGGHVNFDTHADAPGIDYHGYDKGTASTGEKGTLVAAFTGKHGWFWRNRSEGTVTITLRTLGDYSEITRVM